MRFDCNELHFVWPIAIQNSRKTWCLSHASRPSSVTRSRGVRVWRATPWCDVNSRNCWISVCLLALRSKHEHLVTCPGHLAVSEPVNASQCVCSVSRTFAYWYWSSEAGSSPSSEEPSSKAESLKGTSSSSSSMSQRLGNYATVDERLVAVVRIQ